MIVDHVGIEPLLRVASASCENHHTAQPINANFIYHLVWRLSLVVLVGLEPTTFTLIP